MGVFMSLVAEHFRRNQLKVAAYERVLALRESEEKLQEMSEHRRLALDAAGLGVWDYRFETAEVFWDECCRNLFGVAAGDRFDYDATIEHIHSEDRANVDRAMKQALAGANDGIYHREFRVVWPDGSIHWVSSHGRVFFDGAGDSRRAVRFLGVNMDITERKRTEESLERQADLLRLSFDAVVVWRLEGAIESWNRGAEQLYGYSEREALGSITHELLRTAHSVSWQEFEANLRECGTWEGELRHIAKDGREVTVISRHQLIVDGNGVERVLETNRDITERKQAEETLRSTQAKMQGIISSAMDAVISINEQQRIVVFNRAAETIFRCAASEAIGSSIDRFIPKSLKEVHREHIRRFGIGGVTARSMSSPGILEGVRSNGEEFPIEATISQTVAEGERLFTVILRDITERKRAEDALRRQAALIDLTPDVFTVRLLDGTFTYWNRGAEALYGWSKEEAIGQQSHALFQTKFPQRLEEIDEQLKRTGSWTGELIHRTKDGREITVYSKWLAQFDAQGNVTDVLESNADITARKKAEQQIQELNQQLEDRVRRRTAELETANKELETFSYSVSHDLRGPLRTMDGFSQALLEDHSGALDEKGKHYVDRIRKAAQKMGQLIDDLLQLSRIGRSDMQIKVVNLSELALAVIDELRVNDPDRKVDVTIEPGLEVRGDPGLLQVALYNLLSNAWKFTSRREGARIEFGRVKDRPRTAFFVRDNGAGFDMQYADHLFSPFHRLHADEEFKGTGIGLATVQRIIRRHRGSIWAEASQEKGATFYFELGPQSGHSANVRS
jgi:PAS domain S-box-containing protein